MKVTCVLPVHNEQQYLPYSLPRLNKLDVEEILFVLDRCNDDSEGLIRTFGNCKTHVIRKNNSSWKNQCAEAKAYGCFKAEHGLVLMCDADVLIDVNSIETAKRIVQTQNCIVTLSYKQYSLNGTVLERIRDEWLNLIGLVIRKVKLQPTRSGIYLARKQNLFLEDYPSEYDQLQRKHKVVMVKSKTLHLRPRYSKTAQIRRGQARAGLPQYNFLKILLASLLEFQPYMLLAYLRSKK